MARQGIIRKIFILLLAGSALAMLDGCASRPPAPISQAPAEPLSLAEVRAQPARFVGAEVRWGGVITRVENKADRTWIEVVSRELRSNGRPDLDGSSEGRFIASFPGFADPMVYQTDYLLTVTGTLEQPVTRPIGEYEYTFPVVAVAGSYLWKVEPAIPYPDYAPTWWDPWSPYYPRHYPYYPR
jgi:outer membrane lipoprotein